MYRHLPVALLTLLLYAGAARPSEPASSPVSSPASSSGATMEPCAPGVNAPPESSWRWPSDTKVNIYFLRGEFTETEIAAMVIGIRIWDGAAKTTTTGVRFVYGGQTSSPVDCAGCVNVFRGTSWAKNRRLGFFKPLRMDEQGRLQLAQIEVDRKIDDLPTLKTLIIHELGHGMGLWDCPSCHKKSTIMGLFRGHNKSIEVGRPTRCDLNAVSNGFASPYRTAASK